MDFSDRVGKHRQEFWLAKGKKIKPRPWESRGSHIALHLTQGKVALLDWEDLVLTQLRWAFGRPRVKDGYENDGYARRNATNGTGDAYLHNVVMEYVLGRPLTRNERVDHINGDALDCRRANLRVLDPVGNGLHRPRRPTNVTNRSGGIRNIYKRKDGRGYNIKYRATARFAKDLPTAMRIREELWNRDTEHRHLLPSGD